MTNPLAKDTSRMSDRDMTLALIDAKPTTPPSHG